MRDDTAPEPGANGGSPPAPPRDVTLLDLVNVALRYRRSIVLVPLVFMALGVALSMSRPRSYAADGAFMLANAGGDRGGVAGLAAQFGVAVPGGGDDVPQLYADLLVSRRFLGQIADMRVQVSGKGGRRSGTVSQLLEIQGANPADTRRLTVSALRGMVSSKVNPITGVVGFTVATPWPALSEAIGQRLMAMVAEFNLSTRQSQAAAERRFTEARLNDARAELRQAENALASFLESNRRLENAPELVMRRDRLQREVASREGVATLLTQAYERARIDEVRDTPALTVIENPVGSARGMSRDTAVRAMLMFLLGLVLAVGAAFWRETLRVSRERQAPELGEYLRLRDETLGGLLRRRRRATPSGG